MSTRWEPPRLLIDGRLAAASDGATYPVLNPATGERIAMAPDAGPVDMDAAIGAARRAFDQTDWPIDHTGRIECLRRLHATLVAHGPAMRALLTAEGGVPTGLTTGPHYDEPVAGLDRTADLAERYEWETALDQGAPTGVGSGRVLRREPAGVVAAITSWDAPVQVVLAKIGPALAAGCTVVLKPAPDTPWAACELGRLAAGVLPPGVLNVVTTRDVDVAIGLTTDRRVDLVSLTGSTVTGQRVMTTAGSSLTRVHLELGGKSAAIVLDDADLPAVVDRVASSVCVHAGQGAALTTRLLVPRERYDEAIRVAAATMSSIEVGDPADPATVCGPVISPVQRDRVLRYLALAEAEGGTIVAGGRAAESPTGGGWWVEPTVVAGLTNEARVAREEIFGPVLVVLAHDGDDDAVRIANDSPYGLAGSVDSGDVERARAVARRIRVDTVAVNGAAMPTFGGAMSVGGFEPYLETRTLVEDTWPG